MLQPKSIILLDIELVVRIMEILHGLPELQAQCVAYMMNGSGVQKENQGRIQTMMKIIKMVFWITMNVIPTMNISSHGVTDRYGLNKSDR